MMLIHTRQFAIRTKGSFALSGGS